MGLQRGDTQGKFGLDFFIFTTVLRSQWRVVVVGVGGGGGGGGGGGAKRPKATTRY